MTREQLRAQALEAGRNAPRNLRLIRRNPEIIQYWKIEYAVSYLEKMQRFVKEETKNARRSGRTSLRNRLRNLLFSISQNISSVKD